MNYTQVCMHRATMRAWPSTGAASTPRPIGPSQRRSGIATGLHRTTRASSSAYTGELPCHSPKLSH